MAIVATGTTIVFSTSSWTGQIIAIDGSDNESREVLRTSHLGTTGRHTKVPGKLRDGGSYTLRAFYAPGNKPPVSGSAENVTISWGGDTAATDAGSMFVTSCVPSGELEGLVEATIGLEVAS